MIHTSILTRHDEKYDPPEQVLIVQVVDDTVFLGFSKYSETHTSISLQDISMIGVKVSDLLNAIASQAE